MPMSDGLPFPLSSSRYPAGEDRAEVSWHKTSAKILVMSPGSGEPCSLSIPTCWNPNSTGKRCFAQSHHCWMLLYLTGDPGTSRTWWTLLAELGGEAAAVEDGP